MPDASADFVQFFKSLQNLPYIVYNKAMTTKEIALKNRIAGVE